MIELRVVTGDDILPRQVKPNGNVIKIPLVVVAVATFYRDRAAHNRRLELPQLVEQMLGPRFQRL
jgi:hypothetical protein